jgi:hypothetical protein
MPNVLDSFYGTLMSITTKNPMNTGILEVLNKEDVVITYGKY